MILYKLFIAVMLSLSCYVGAQIQLPEDKIYNAIDTFIATPKQENLNNLTLAEQDFYKNKSPKTANQFLAIVILNCNKAFYENQFGQTLQAISSYEKSWKIYQKNKLKDYDIIEYCLKPLGNLYTIMGDYSNAENTIKQYYFLAETNKNEPLKIAAILNLSNVYQNSGKTQNAIDLLTNTIKTGKISSLQKGILYNNLGSSLMLANKKIDARTAFEKSINLLKIVQNQNQNLSNAYSNLSSIYANENNFALANFYYDKACKLFFENKNIEPRKVAKFNLNYAALFFKEQDYKESSLKIVEVFKDLIPNYSNKKSLLPSKNQLYAETILIDALDLQAVIFMAQNLPKKALETYDLSFYIEDLFSNLVVYENSKIINQTRIRNRVEKCIEIYDLLYKTENNYNYLETAFLLSDKTKSGVLKNYLAQNKIFSKAEKSLQNELQKIANDIVKEQQKADYADLNKINDLIKQQNQTMLLIKSQPKSTALLSEKKIDLKKLFAKLDTDKTILIEYFAGQNTIYSFALSDNKIILTLIANSEINKNKIIKFIDYFANPDAIANNVAGYNLSGNLVYNLLQFPKTDSKNVVIVPDGLLNFVPFDALITKTSTTSNFAKMNYLMNDYAIAYNNSASFYLDANLLSHKNSVLGIFPIFEKTDYELAFSKTEMQAIKNNFDGLFFENASASFNNFRDNASKFSILHLSTHADAGGIEIPASIKFFDQEILYSELYNLKINPDLVVLSACQTGIGKLYKSEGAMSVARGFQLAGARNLLFSLWKVNDYTTSVFMANFYKNIKNNIPFFEANRQAKQDFLEDQTISNTKKSPYYWSAFVYYGTLEKPTNSHYLIWISVGMVFVFLVWFLMIRNIKNKLPTKNIIMLKILLYI